MVSVVMLNAVMLNAIMLSVVAPKMPTYQKLTLNVLFDVMIRFLEIEQVSLNKSSSLQKIQK
jgi:hypothetical protein